jgi:hypothetical protein
MTGYDIPSLTDLLVEGFTTGFKIPFTAKEEPTVSTNLKSAKENIDILQANIEREIASGRIAGPFQLSICWLVCGGCGLIICWPAFILYAHPLQQICTNIHCI